MKRSSMEAVRRFALRLPEVDEGIACAGTALEARTLRRRDKAFLFLRASEARFKLGPSLAEAERLAAEEPERVRVGANGWVLVKLEGAGDPHALLERWIAESHGLFGGGKAAAAAKPAAAKRKASKRNPGPARKKASRKTKRP